MSKHRRRPRSRPAFLVGIFALLAALTGCAQLPFADDSFEQKIPAALREASFAVTDAWAEKGVDGFVTYLSVGLTVEDEEFTSAQLREVLRIVAANNTIGASKASFAVELPSGDRVELEPLFNELGVTDVRGYGRTISWDDLERAAAE
ncbi:hypothetical protein GCM10027058_22460 [Microbacterium neimengense]